MTNQEMLNEVRAALAAYDNGKLSEFACLFVIGEIVNPSAPTAKDMEWAEKKLAEPRGNK